MSDEVIVRIESRKTKMEDTLTFLETRKASAEKRIASSDGNIRTSYSTEVALRKVEIDEIKKLLTALNQDLEHAKADLPRRDSERKKAAELQRRAQEMEGKAAAFTAKAEEAQNQANQFLMEAEGALNLAKFTADELKANQPVSEPVHA